MPMPVSETANSTQLLPLLTLRTASARASSWLIFGNLIENRLPRLLLLVNERRGFGG